MDTASMPVTASAAPFIAPVPTSFAGKPQGERLEADTRLVVAPDAGVFEPALDLTSGRQIQAGQVIGHLHSGSQSVPVVSPFSGRSGDALAWQGERLTAHQPVMWLSLDAGRP
jgi:predicted deacylase